MGDLAAAAARFDRALTTVDAGTAVDLVEELLAAGADPVAVLADVIGATQREVGWRWQRGMWSVAQEHAATAVSVSAVEAVARHVRRVPATRGRVVVACAEREWHSLPAMIIAYALRAGGWDTVLLGAATPPVRLSRYLQDLGPDATAVSSSVLGSLPSTRRFVEASTTAGIPIVAGGSAFGPDDRRATAIGATAWAAGAREVAAAVAAMPPVVPAAPPLPAGPAAELSAIEMDHPRLAATVGAGWTLAAEIASGEAEQLEAVRAIREDVVDQALHAACAALLTGDARTLPDTADWVAELLAARGADLDLVAELGELLAGALRDYPLAGELVHAHWVAGRSAR